MTKYNVDVDRVTVERITVTVEAANEEMATDIAVKMARDAARFEWNWLWSDLVLADTDVEENDDDGGEPASKAA